MSAETDNADNSGTKTNGGEESGVRRRSRWGDRNDADADGEGTRKRSRWGAKDEAPVVGLSAGAALLVQQNPELIKIQIRLNEIQRLQALPRLLGGLMNFSVAASNINCLTFLHVAFCLLLIRKFSGAC